MNEYELEELGKKIKELRLKCGLTQKELADKTNISQSSINFWENGKRTPKHSALIKLANALNIPLYKLTRYLYGENQFSLIDFIQEQSILSAIGNNIKKCREQKELSLEQLSTMLKIPYDLLQEYESGTKYIPFSVLNEISSVLGVNNIDLVGIDNKYFLAMMSFEQPEHFNEFRNDTVTIDGILISDNTILEHFHQLNNTGKKAAIDRVTELKYIPGYTGDDEAPF